MEVIGEYQLYSAENMCVLSGLTKILSLNVLNNFKSNVYSVDSELLKST